MALTFQGGQALPAVGTAAYNAAAAAPSGTGSYNPSTNTLSSGGNVIYSPTSNATVPQTPSSITGANTAPAQPIPIPQMTAPQNLTGLMVGNNAGLGGNGVVYDANSGLLQYQDPTQKVLDESKSNFDSELANLRAPVKTADIYAQEYAANDIQGKQQQVQNYTNQINTITAKAQADQLSLVGQGRGVPEVIIGGQQAQVAREAAIAVLPVQAQLAAAQGNLQLAQQHLDTVFKLKAADAQADNDFYNKQVELAYNFFDKNEQRQLDAIKTTRQENIDTYNKTLDFAKSLAERAFTEKNYTLGGQITNAALSASIDPSSKDFKNQIATLNGTVGSFANKITAGTGTTAAPKIEKINGVDMQWNPTAGKWEMPATSSTGNGGVQQQASIKANIDLANNILTSPALSSTVGPNVFARFLSRGYNDTTGATQDFIASVNQLSGQLTLDSLVNAKQRGATFGALSDGERELLAQSGSKLNSWAIKDKNGNVTGYNASEKAFKAEVDKVNNFAKLDYVLKGGNPEDVGATKMPDGTVWVKNSDGSFTQLK